MFENIVKFFKKAKKDNVVPIDSKSAAKERLHLVLMQDRANVSADFLDLMKQEIIDVIKKYIEVDENAIDVRLTNKENEDGTSGAPALYANIPILNIKNEIRKMETKANTDKTIEEKSEKTDSESINENVNVNDNKNIDAVVDDNINDNVEKNVNENNEGKKSQTQHSEKLDMNIIEEKKPEEEPEDNKTENKIENKTEEKIEDTTENNIEGK